MDWKKETNLLSNFYLKFYSKWPFNKVQSNKNIIESVNYSNKYHSEALIPVEDILRHRMTSVSQIIPIEKLSIFAKKYDSFLAKCCEKQKSFEKRDPISHFSNISLWGGGWFNLGFAVLFDKNLIDSFSSYAYRITDSFVQITFNFHISDTRKYLFYNLLRKKYLSDIFLITKKRPVLFRNQALKIYGPRFQLQHEIYTYFETIRSDILSFLNEQKLLVHISEYRSIDFTNILSFKKIRRTKKHDFKSFWNIFSLENDLCFVNEKRNIYFPEGMNLGSDIGVIGHYIFYSEEDFVLPSGFLNFEHFMHSQLLDWGASIIQNLTINNALNEYYRQISSFRMNYFEAKDRQVINRYSTLQRTIYWINLFSNEYQNNRDRNIWEKGPSLINKIFGHETNLLESIIENNKLKLQSLFKLSKFIEDNINKYDNYRLVRSNKIIQVFIVLLTVLTVIIGVIQIFGLKAIDSLFNETGIFVRETLKYLLNAF